MSKRKHLIQFGKQPRSKRRSPLANMGWFPSTDKMDQSQASVPITAAGAAAAARPTSQRAATTPMEPDDEQVQHLMEFTGLTRSVAVRYLKAKSNDVNAAAMAYFEGEDISKAEAATQWDEGAWGAGKEGEYGNTGLHPLGSSAAATRPNSPAPSTGGRANLHPTSKQQEEDDLAQAMAMSQGDLRGAYQQETGRIGADGQQTQFGPATKEYYEDSKWAMVPTGVHNTSEIVPDADAEHRVHSPGEPRFLKYLPTGDYSPNLLSICHAIPGAREALLLRDHVQVSYGQDAEWWRGHSISLPKIVNVEDGSSAQPDSDMDDAVLAEIQRLMAFLDASHRSYGSVGALTQTDTIKFSNASSTSSRTLLELFLQQWTLAASQKSKSGIDIATLFGTTVGTNAPEGVSTPDMKLIDMQVNILPEGKSDLFEQLDDLLWDTNDNDSTMSDNYIERPAEVLVMRAYQQNATANPQLRLEVPAEFYVDKYLPENIEATRAIRMQMADGRRRIAKIDEIERKLKTWKHPTKNERIESNALLRHTFGHFSGKNRLEVLNADKLNPIANPEDIPAEQPHYQDIARKLEKVLESIDDKLFLLSEEKEKTRKAIADMSKAPPAGLSEDDLKHRYTLRGVATKPNITYVLCPVDAEADEADEMLDDDSTPRGSRWWRIEYEVSGSAGANITKTKSADYDVLRAVELEHSSALLVYASDRITDPGLPDLPLPQILQEFVQKDNELFAAELHSERQHKQPPAYDFTNDDTTAMYGAVDRTSMDSTRVEGAGSDLGGPSPPRYPHDDDDPFLEHREYGDIKQGYRLNELDGLEDVDEAPVHEIKLGTPPEDEGVEMVERHSSGVLIPGLDGESNGGAAGEER